MMASVCRYIFEITYLLIYEYLYEKVNLYLFAIDQYSIITNIHIRVISIYILIIVRVYILIK